MSNIPKMGQLPTPVPNSYWIHHPKVQEVQEDPTNARDLLQPPALPAPAALCPEQLLALLAAAAAAARRCAAAMCCVRLAVAKRRVEVWQPGNLGHAVDLSCGYPPVTNGGWKIAELNGRFKMENSSIDCYRWWIFNCHVWLPEGKSSSGYQVYHGISTKLMWHMAGMHILHHITKYWYRGIFQPGLLPASSSRLSRLQLWSIPSCQMFLLHLMVDWTNNDRTKTTTIIIIGLSWDIWPTLTNIDPKKRASFCSTLW